MTSTHEVQALITELNAGRISRRTFFHRASALGVSLPVILGSIHGVSAGARVAAEPAAGGSVTVALSNEPTTVNRYVSSKSADGWISNLVIEPLLQANVEGDYEPVLVTDVPTLQNGGISEDGLTYTYTLRDDVTWSDGEPFTSKDVVFTYDMVMDDANPITARSIYNAMASVEAPDDHTVVVTFAEFYAGALEAFAGGILPAHHFDGNTDINGSDFDRNPVGTGPFVVKSWEASRAIIFEPNPHYREAGKPYLDQIIFAIVPSPDVATAQLEAGEVDIVLNLRENEGVYLEEQALEHIGLLVSPSPSVERVQFNLAAPGQPSDPAVPHPVLGDPVVREALSLATPREEIVNDLIGGGFVTATGSTLPYGWAAPDPPIEIPPYDIDQANALLDEAGWIMNGKVREKDGQKLTIELVSTPEQHRTLAMQVLAERWGMIGAQVEVTNQQSTVILGSWEEKGLRAMGDFDGMIYASSAFIDPHSHFRNRYHSDAIPSEENGGKGDNFNRLADPELDALIVEAGAAVDQDARKPMYREINELLNSHNANIWLYARSGIDAHNTRVGGLEARPWNAVTFNTQDWFIVDED